MYSVVLMMALTTGGEAPAWHGGGGCCGCYGGGYASCGCYGGGGHHRHHRHHGGGCCGCYGGGYACWGGGCYGGGYGGGCGCCGSYVSYGCCGCYGGGYMYGPGGYGPGGSGGSGGSGTGGGKVGSGEISAPATIVVNLPQDAKLMIDDYQTKSTSASRTLQTPNLPYGKEFSYTLKVEVVREGKTVTESKQITVRGGQVTPVSFDSTALVASK
jgi:uncharacterized protein (TIGR03000 family)